MASRVNTMWHIHTHTNVSAMVWATTTATLKLKTSPNLRLGFFETSKPHLASFSFSTFNTAVPQSVAHMPAHSSALLHIVFPALAHLLYLLADLILMDCLFLLLSSFSFLFLFFSSCYCCCCSLCCWQHYFPPINCCAWVWLLYYLIVFVPTHFSCSREPFADIYVL